MPFAMHALSKLLMSNGSASYGRLLQVANNHVDAFLGLGDDEADDAIERLDDVVKAINTAHERTYALRGPSYAEVVGATRDSNLRLDVGAHGEQHLSDVSCLLRIGAMEGGFALGLALAFRIGGTR